MRLFFFTIIASMVLFAPSQGRLKLKKLARVALFGAAIAPRFVPIPIPHHVYKHDRKWLHGSHGWDHGHGHPKELFTFQKGGSQHYGAIHDASSSYGGHGWW